MSPSSLETFPLLSVESKKKSAFSSRILQIGQAVKGVDVKVQRLILRGPPSRLLFVLRMGMTTKSRTEFAISRKEPLAGAGHQEELFGTPDRKLFRPLGVAERTVRHIWFRLVMVLAIAIKTMMRAKKVRPAVLGLFPSTGRHFFFLVVVVKWEDFFFVCEKEEKK